jgi:VanZ like family
VDDAATTALVEPRPDRRPAVPLIHLATRMLGETKVAIALLVGFAGSVVAGRLLSRRMVAGQAYLVMTIFSVVFVAVAVLQMGRAGGGVLDRNPLSVLSFGRLSRCAHPWIDSGGVFRWDSEAVLNLLLYMPLGVFATLASRRPVATLAVSAALAIVLEALQTVLDAGTCAVMDVTRNVAGLALAAGCTAAGLWIVGRRRAGLRSSSQVPQNVR